MKAVVVDVVVVVLEEADTGKMSIFLFQCVNETKLCWYWGYDITKIEMKTSGYFIQSLKKMSEDAIRGNNVNFSSCVIFSRSFKTVSGVYYCCQILKQGCYHHNRWLCSKRSSILMHNTYQQELKDWDIVISVLNWKLTLSHNNIPNTMQCRNPKSEITSLYTLVKHWECVQVACE